jgi:hypothetical protein
LQLDQAIARYEADEEVQDLLNSSLGLNLGVDFLPGSFGFDPTFEVDPDVAARTLWLDALVANVDRSWRNPNLLAWHGDLWLIDHGASLYFHHAWSSGVTDPARFAAQPYDATDHVLVKHASRAAGLDTELAERIDDDTLDDVLEKVPDEWLEPRPGAGSPQEVRAAYRGFLRARLDGARTWVPGRAAA